MSFKNHRKQSFLDRFPTASLDSSDDKIASLCKFNFSYFTHDQPAGQNFSDWTEVQLHKLLDKLVNYSKKSLVQWEKETIGQGKNHVLEVYGSFPKKSDFTQPKHIPHQAKWARFRLEGSVRLIGFVIPDDFNKKEQNKSSYNFCSNTFYIVFLDKDHNFYK